MTRGIAVAALAGLTLGFGSAAHAASVNLSGFDQVARINTLGGTVNQIGGTTPGAALANAAAFGGTPDTASGVSVNLPGWCYVTKKTSISDVPPSQVGNVSSVLLGAPTDITFTLPGAGGPDGTVGDGSFSFSQGDDYVGSFQMAITAEAGVTQDLFIFTDTDGGGVFRLDVLLAGVVVDSLGGTNSSGGAAGTGFGGFLIDLVDGTVFDSVRIFAAGSTFEVDAIAARCIPLPTAVHLGLAGLLGIPALRRRR